MPRRSKSRSRSARRKSRGRHSSSRVSTVKDEATTSNAGTEKDDETKIAEREEEVAKRGGKIDKDVNDLQRTLESTCISDESEASDLEALGGAVGGIPNTDWGNEAALVKYNKTRDSDDGDDDEKVDVNHDKDEKMGDRRTMRTCLQCGKSSKDDKRCGSCGVASYCDKTCQKKHWRKNHKNVCANYKCFRENITVDLLATLFLRFLGFCRLRTSLDFVQLESTMLEVFASMMWPKPKQCVVLKIVGRYPHWLCPAYYVQDADGFRTHVRFDCNTEEIRILNPADDFPFFVPLRLALKPGCFICLIDPVWHFFLDGSLGIRIDSGTQFELP